MENIHAHPTPDLRQNPATGKVMVEAQGHLLKLVVQSQQQLPLGGGLRGSILKFTSRSRKRMLETLARLDEARMGFVCFVTLTYPTRDTAPGFEQSTADRKAFFKRLQRRFPASSAIWRREWEKRKSGTDAGALYPHFHCIFFNLPFVHYTEVNRLWCAVIGATGYVRTEIRAVENWRHAFAYVAKYMAKAEHEEPEGGEMGGLEERDGRISPADSNADEAGAVGGEVDRRTAGIADNASSDAAPLTDSLRSEDVDRDSRCSLVYRTYQAAETGECSKSELYIEAERGKTGRHWGVFNRSKLPLADPSSHTLAGGEWYTLAKEIAAEVWPGVAENPFPGGFTLFTERADELKDYFVHLAEKEDEE